jgi:DNA-binding response OmpR family regulator
MMPSLLLADDSRTTEQLVRLSLEPEGYEITVRPDGESAWDFLQSGSPDLALIDVGLPGIDGYSLCRRIRTEGSDPQLPVILLGGAGVPVDSAQALACGCRDWLVKPLDAEVLASVVGELLTRSAGSETAPAPAVEPLVLAANQCSARLTRVGHKALSPVAHFRALDEETVRALSESLTRRLTEALPEMVSRTVRELVSPSSVSST